MGGDTPAKLPLIARKSIRDVEQGLFKEYAERIRKAMKEDDWNMDAVDWDAIYHAIPEENEYKNRIGEVIGWYFGAVTSKIEEFAKDELFVDTLNEDAPTHLLSFRFGKVDESLGHSYFDTKIVDKKLMVTVAPERFASNTNSCGDYLERAL